jgi:hypothetical protein
MFQIFLRHLCFVGDEPGHVLRVVDSGVIQIHRQLVVLLDLLLDLLHLFDLHAVHRLFDAVVEHGLFVPVGAERLELLDDFGRGHVRTSDYFFTGC